LATAFRRQSITGRLHGLPIHINPVICYTAFTSGYQVAQAVYIGLPTVCPSFAPGLRRPGAGGPEAGLLCKRAGCKRSYNRYRYPPADHRVSPCPATSHFIGMSGGACEIRVELPLLQPPVDPASRDGSGMGAALKIWQPKGNPPDCRTQPCNLANCPVTWPGDVRNAHCQARDIQDRTIIRITG